MYYELDTSTRIIADIPPRFLGENIGIKGLSPHDLRHYWATKLANSKTPIDKLMSAGGWNSPAMPLRYIEASRIANDGIDLDDD